MNTSKGRTNCIILTLPADNKLSKSSVFHFHLRVVIKLVYSTD